jgi:hypothetical protein
MRPPGATSGGGLEIGDVPKWLMARATGHQFPTVPHSRCLQETPITRSRCLTKADLRLPAAERIHPQPHLQLFELLIVLVARGVNVLGLGDELHLLVATDSAL